MAAFGVGMPQGSMDAVNEALNRRGMGGSVPQLSQVSGMAPSTQGAVPQVPTGNPIGMPSAQPQAPQQMVGAVPQTQDEAKLIVNGLVGRLKALSQAQQGGVGL